MFWNKHKYQENQENVNLRSRFAFLPTTNYSPPTNKGFSLIELIAVVTITTIITGIALINHSVFSGGVALENLAYEIALTVRQAQFFGMNVKGFGTGESVVFESAYGVYFTTSNPTSFILFADIDEDREYDGVSELVEQYNIIRGNRIKYLCVDTGGLDYCDSPSESPVTDLSIFFLRPDPDAIIKTDNTGDCGSDPSIGCSYAQVYVGSPKDEVLDKIINVSIIGQISISTESN